jgi:hypothetical protein
VVRDARQEHHAWARHVFNLGAALLIQYRDRRRPEDLDESVGLLRTAVGATADGDPARPGRLSTFGLALRARFERTESEADLAEALERLNAAVEICPAQDPDRAEYLLNLGLAFKTRFEKDGSPEDFHAAVSAWQQATTIKVAPAEVRATAAHQWGAMAAAAAKRDLALEGYAEAVSLLPLLGWRGLNRDDQLHQLGRWADLASDAAACAILVGQPQRAVELLEQGRTVVWSPALETRTDLTALEGADPALATRIRQVRTVLDDAAWDETANIAERPPDPVSTIAASTERARRRMALATEWADLMDQARGLVPDFIREPRAAELQRAATDGPVVIVNLSRYGCHALIITTRDVRAIPLPKLEVDDTLDRADGYLEALRRREDEAVSAAILIELADAAEATTNDTLEWLWDSVANPVLTNLGYTHTPDGDRWPRIWWCPTGPLTLLPLHAAGYYRAKRANSDTAMSAVTPNAPGHASVLDRVISSYTPTLRTLLRARQQPEAGPAGRRLLIVAMPETPGQPSLPQAELDAERLARRFPNDHTLLPGPQATRARVLIELTGHAWVHFACHGRQDLERPASGGVAVHDGLLTVSDIAGERLENAELAFLSACETAVGGIRVPDEAIHLAAALQFAGYQHVIATLWSTTDRSARVIAEDTYRSLSDSAQRLDPARAAEALHQATRRRCHHLPDYPTRWASFIHLGP